MSQSKLPISKEGLPFIVKFVAAGCLLALFPYVAARILAALSFILAIFCVYFFRDPERQPVDDPSFVLAPGDGKIMEVVEEAHPHLGPKTKVIRIFLSVFDIHVQRAPISGTVKSVEYKKGKFLDARNGNACIENERNEVVIEGEHLKAAVRQIAGFIARRIVCWVQPGDTLRLGQRLGLIRFGSQVDLYLPPSVDICVKKGDRVVSGVSVVAISKGVIEKLGVPAVERQKV